MTLVVIYIANVSTSVIIHVFYDINIRYYAHYYIVLYITLYCCVLLICGVQNQNS